MIVFYSKPNTLRLPYFDKNKIQKFYTFMPGKNHIETDVWLSIVELAGKNMEHYETILSVFQSKGSKTIPIKGGDNFVEANIGEDEDNIKYKMLNVRDMTELIENTMDKIELEEYLKIEKNKDKPRITITRLLDDKLEQISEIEEALKKE